MTDARNAIACRITEARTRIGLSQSELARRMNSIGHTHYTQMTVSRSEKAERSIHLEEAPALAQCLEVSVVWLATGEHHDHHAYLAGRQSMARDVQAHLASIVAP